MVKNYEQFLEAHVWPKIITWKKGENLSDSKILNSVNKNFAKNLSDYINLGYIVELEKYAYNARDKHMKITLSNGTKHIVQMYDTMASGFNVSDTNWKKTIGITDLLSNDPKTIKVEDWDYIMCLPGYIKLIESGFVDETSEANKKSGVIIMSNTRTFVEITRDYDTNDGYSDYYLNEKPLKYLYKFYNNGKVTTTIRNFHRDGSDYVDTLQRVQSMKGSWKEFEPLFQVAIKREDELDAKEKNIREIFSSRNIDELTHYNQVY